MILLTQLLTRKKPNALRPGGRPALFGGKAVGASGARLRVKTITLRLAWLVAALVLWQGSGIGAEKGVPNEVPPESAQAAYLLKFGPLITWPAKAFPKNNSPLVFGVIGDSPIAEWLPSTLANEVINGRKLAFKQVTPGHGPTNCHVLFISESEKDRLSSHLKALRGAPVLTVSDMDRFAQRGGMVKFVLNKDKTIGFEINQQAAKQAGIEFDSRLLRLAKPLETDAGKERK